MAICLLIAAPCLAQPLLDLEPDAPAAIVEDQVITAGELLEELKARYAMQVLERIIFEAEVRKRAGELGLAVSDDEVIDVALEQLSTEERPLATRAEVDEYVAERGVVPSVFYRDLRHDILLDKVLRADIEVTDDELRHLYDQDARKPEGERVFTVGFAALLRVILKSAEADARTLKATLEPGNFAAYAASNISEHPARDQGGDLGWLTLAELPPAKDLGLFVIAGEVGAIGGPFECEDPPGWLLVLLENRRDDAPLTFEQAKDHIYTVVMDSRISAKMRDWTTRIHRLSRILALSTALRAVIPDAAAQPTEVPEPEGAIEPTEAETPGPATAPGPAPGPRMAPPAE